MLRCNFISQGFSRTGAAALLGNFIYESGHSLRPQRQQNGVPKDTGVGIAQWAPDRQANLKKTPYPWTLRGQAQFVIAELQKTPGLDAELRNHKAGVDQTTVDNMTDHVEQTYENSSVPALKQRENLARRMINGHL